jgi:hypothetical protein
LAGKGKAASVGVEIRRRPKRPKYRVQCDDCYRSGLKFVQSVAYCPACQKRREKKPRS